MTDIYMMIMMMIY